MAVDWTLFPLRGYNGKPLGTATLADLDVDYGKLLRLVADGRVSTQRRRRGYVVIGTDGLQEAYRRLTLARLVEEGGSNDQASRTAFLTELGERVLTQLGK